MIYNQSDPYTIGEFEFKDGKGKFTILVDRLKDSHPNIHGDLPVIFERKIEEMPEDKKIVYGTQKVFHKSNMLATHPGEEILCIFEYHQLTEEEVKDKAESKRIEYFVNNLKLITNDPK